MFDPWVGKILWGRKCQPTPVLVPGKSHGQRSVVGYSPRGHKELDTTERLTQQQDVLGFPGNSAGKKSTLSLGDPSSIPGLGRSPGEGKSNSLPYSCLGNPMDRGVWQVIVHGVAKTCTRLSE